MGSVILHFLKPSKPRERSIPIKGPETSRFDDARSEMLRAFSALAAADVSRADLTDEMIATLRAMRSLHDLLTKKETTDAR